ncbi:MAG: GNAT family N-acetyltransferase [Nocardioidaceae bacterium]
MVWWKRTRRSHDDGYGGADPRRAGDHRPRQRGVLGRPVLDEPVGWVAVEPRTAYPKLRTSRVPWSGRAEDKSNDDIWAVTCFVVRKGYRGRGLTYPLARATIDFARERGARALEAYPMITHPGKEITWGEVHVGARQVFEDPGSRRSAAPPFAGWSCGSTSSQETAYVDVRDQRDQRGAVPRRRVDRGRRAGSVGASGDEDELPARSVRCVPYTVHHEAGGGQ